MNIRWITAFIDVPADQFRGAAEYWCAVTGSSLSTLRGGRSQFATFVPSNGTPFLRLQRIDTAEPRIHLDFDVENFDAAVAECAAAGAELVVDHGYAILTSPGGFVFCLVSSEEGPQRPTSNESPAGAVSLVDQVCLGIPSRLIAAERAFWAMVTGWELRNGSRPEFTFLERPAGMPLRILMQDNGSGNQNVVAHIDVACGAHVSTVRAEHERLGGRVVAEFPAWTTMADPSGLAYCLTSRDPFTGALSAGH